MFSQNEEIILNNHFESPEKLKETIESLRLQMPPILDDFKKYFVLTHKQPTYSEYQNGFDNVKQNVNTLSSSLFAASNTIESGMERISKLFLQLNKLIEQERKTNRILKGKLGLVEQNSNGSDEMIGDFNEIFDMTYLQAWAMGLLILFASRGIYVLLRPSAAATAATAAATATAAASTTNAASSAAAAAAAALKAVARHVRPA